MRAEAKTILRMTACLLMKNHKPGEKGVETNYCFEGFDPSA